jgi:HEAT repeat protein
VTRFKLPVISPLLTTLEVQRTLKKLRSDNPVSRFIAADKLGNLGDKRAVEPLIAALKDNDETVRLHAAEALGNLGDARAWNRSSPLSTTASIWPRYQAVLALGAIGGPGRRMASSRLANSDQCA